MFMAYKCMHNFPPHPSYVATLPDHTLANSRIGTLFSSCGDCSEKIMDDATLTTNEFQYSLKFQVLIDVSVVHLSD